MTFRMSNKLYDTLKWVLSVLLPALATLYFALSELWRFPYVSEVLGTISAIELFLATILGISTAQYTSDKLKEEVNENILLVKEL